MATLDTLVLVGKCCWGIIALYIVYKIFTMKGEGDGSTTISSNHPDSGASHDATGYGRTLD